jgi:hypothetical protein
VAIPFEIGKKPLPPEFAGALPVGAARPDFEIFHVQVLAFGRCLHCPDAPCVIQAIDRAAQCPVCNRRYVFSELRLAPDTDGMALNVVVTLLPEDDDHPIRRPASN